jgi:hypothetical protein
MPPSESDPVLRRINEVLASRFHIAHTTIQFEHVSCGVSHNGCSIPVHHHRRL